MRYLVIILMSVASVCAGQCPGDLCSDPMWLQCSADSTVCEEPVCNGICQQWASGNWYCAFTCGEEDAGNPVSCWSQEHDRYTALAIPATGLYQIDLVSNYVAPQYESESIIGGIQMAIYPSSSCPDEVDPVWMSPCSGGEFSQYQVINLQIYLTPGEYLTQIDGFGRSWGCAQLCVSPVCVLYTDINGNGSVEIDDLLFLMSAYGTEGVADAADFNADGVVDGTDLLQLIGEYGSNCWP